MQITDRTTDRVLENGQLSKGNPKEAKVCKTFIRRFDPDPRLQENTASIEVDCVSGLPADSPEVTKKHRNALPGPSQGRTAEPNGPTRRDCEPKLYRRHVSACRGKSCRCPIWLWHMTRDGLIRRSLRTGDMEKAREISELEPLKSACLIDEVLAAKCILAIASRADGSSDPRLVYFISSGRAVKIGIAADPQKRLRELQTASARELRLRRQVFGGMELEQELHELLAPLSRRGEWFDLDPTLTAIIARTRKLHGEFARLNFPPRPAVSEARP